MRNELERDKQKNDELISSTNRRRKSGFIFSPKNLNDLF